MAYGQTASPQQRFRPITQVTLGQPQQTVNQPIQPPGPAQMDPAQAGTLPVYNNPANAPKNEFDLANEASALPQRPRPGQTFGTGKAQGGDGPASNTGFQDPTGHAPIQPMTNRPQYQPVTPKPSIVRPLQPTIPVNPITPATSPVGSNMRGEIYTPGNDPRLIASQGRTDAAAGAVAGMNRQGMQGANEGRYRSIYGDGQIDPSQYGMNTDVRYRGVNTGPSARTNAYGMAQDQALAGLGGPDRTALALQKLKDFDAASNETRFNEERDLGRNIAKFGRTGLQANADNFGDIQRRIAGDRGRLANELAMGVSEGDINDRFRRLDSVSGLRGQEAGLDQQAYGRNANERDTSLGVDEGNITRRIGERDTRLGIATGNEDRRYRNTNAALGYAGDQTDRAVGDQFDQLNAATSLEDRIFGQGQSNRNEFRTERDYQGRDAQQTIENRIREMEAQNALEDLRLRRSALQAQAGGL